MKTAGYDIVLLLNENFLNTISGAMFYNNFLTFKDQKDFRTSLPADKLNLIPPDLRDLLVIKYRVKLLYEPYLNFIEGNKIQISAKLRVYLWMMQGLEFKFDASLTMITAINVDESTKYLNIDMKSADIQEFKIRYNYTADESISLQMDKIFEKALHAYFSDATKPFRIELPSIPAAMPFIDSTDGYNIINVDVRAIKTVSPTTIAIAANLLGYTGGDPNQLTEFAKNCNVGVGISEMAMNKVYDFFWERTNWDKKFFKSGSFKIDMVDKVLGFLTDLTNMLLNVVEFATLGFVEDEIDFVSSDFLYSVDMDFKTRPTFDIQDGNRVRIFNLGVDLMLRLKMTVTFDYTLKIDTSGPVPDKCTPWEDDVILEKVRKTLVVFDIGVPISNLKIKSCTGELTIDEVAKTLVCKVLELDVNIYDYVDAACKFLLLPESIRKSIIDGIKQKVVDSIPPIVVSPMVFDLKIKFIPWVVKIEGRKLEITDNEAIAGAYVYFEELEKNMWPVPKYIGNYNNMEVHLAGCDSVLDTYETHQRGYFLLQDALNDDYDGCKKCLPAFHKR